MKRTPSRLTPPSPLPMLAALLLGSASSLAGCALSAEASVPDIEITQHGIAVAGIPMAGRLGDVATQLSFMENLPSIDLPAGIDTTVKAVAVDLTATEGVTDLSFLRTLRVVMAPSAGTAAPVELIEELRKHTHRPNCQFVFPSPTGNREQHMLDHCKSIAKRANSIRQNLI